MSCRATPPDRQRVREDATSTWRRRAAGRERGRPRAETGVRGVDRTERQRLDSTAAVEARAVESVRRGDWEPGAPVVGAGNGERHTMHRLCVRPPTLCARPFGRPVSAGSGTPQRVPASHRAGVRWLTPHIASGACSGVHGDHGVELHICTLAKPSGGWSTRFSRGCGLGIRGLSRIR